jgi:3-oxoacyl-[acyl-carrier-protein] synthase-3
MSGRSIIQATGSYLPARALHNNDLARMVDTSHDWIVQRTGIETRHIAGEGETTSYMAARAAERALQAGGYSAADIDGIIVATTSPDHTFPAVAVDVQADLGIGPVCAFDIQAVCSGFIYAMSVADAMLRTGAQKRILVIGAETMSALLDWSDRSTCVLFGDGAGAIVMEASDSDDGRGILSTHLYADGNYKELLYTNGGASDTNGNGYIRMQGRDVFKHAVALMSDIVTEVTQANNITGSDIDWLVPHQANIRIIEATAAKLEMDMSRVIVTVERHGNTSAASIPLALDEGVRDGRIKAGDTVLFEALGGGLTWGAALVRI